MSRISDEFVIEAVYALCVRAVLAEHLGCLLFVLGVNCCAVKASSPWAVVTLWLIIFFYLHIFGRLLLLVDTDTVEAFSSRRMVTFRCYRIISELTKAYYRSLALIPV